MIGSLLAIMCLGLAGGDTAVAGPTRAEARRVGSVTEHLRPPTPAVVPDLSPLTGPAASREPHPVVVEPDPDPTGPCDGPSADDEPWTPAVLPPALGENRGESHDLFLRDDREICVVYLAAVPR